MPLTQGNKRENLIPRSGEFFVLKSKAYEDPSVALKIPINELLDGTKTTNELRAKHSKKSFTDSETASVRQPSHRSRNYDVLTGDHRCWPSTKAWKSSRTTSTRQN